MVPFLVLLHFAVYLKATHPLPASGQPCLSVPHLPCLPQLDSVFKHYFIIPPLSSKIYPQISLVLTELTGHIEEGQLGSNNQAKGGGKLSVV